MPCSATRRDGTPCTNRIIVDPDTQRCFAHSERRADQRREAHAKGGRSKSSTARAQRLVPGTLRPVLALLLKTLNETHGGDLDPKVAGALAAVAGAIVKVYQAGVVEDRLAELEGQIATLTRDRRPA